jgi:hypothetical protein
MPRRQITPRNVNPSDDGNIKLINYLKYIIGRGPLATTGCDRGAFVNTRGEECAGWDEADGAPQRATLC